MNIIRCTLLPLVACTISTLYADPSPTMNQALLDTKLIQATQTGNISQARLLLAKKARANACDMYGSTPLHYAADRGHLAIVELLIKYLANTNAMTQENINFVLGLLNNAIGKTTPLMLAALKGYPKIVKLLLEHGARVNLQDSYGQTALLYAILADAQWPYRPLSKQHKKIVSLLLDYGADPAIQDELGHDARYYYTHLAALVPGYGPYGYASDQSIIEHDELYQRMK